jgi:hypothetical protein
VDDCDLCAAHSSLQRGNRDEGASVNEASTRPANATDETPTIAPVWKRVNEIMPSNGRVERRPHKRPWRGQLRSTMPHESARTRCYASCFHSASAAYGQTPSAYDRQQKKRRTQKNKIDTDVHLRWRGCLKNCEDPPSNRDTAQYELCTPRISSEEERRCKYRRNRGASQRMKGENRDCGSQNVQHVA